MVVIDLFCGAGGLTEGLRLGGVSVTHAIDSDEAMLKTYRSNHPHVWTDNEDLQYCSPEDLGELADLPFGPIDLVCGGPPCSGFSVAARPKGGLGDWRDDPRNELVLVFARYVTHFSPRFFLMENVPGLLSLPNAQDDLLCLFESSGYEVWCVELNSADFGAPQRRKRVFFFGRNDRRELRLPEPTHSGSADPQQSLLFPRKGVPLPWVTVREAFAGLDFSGSPNHILPRHHMTTVERMRRLKPGESLNGNHAHVWRRLHWDQPAWTVMPWEATGFVHPSEPRTLTVRENAVLQGFPLGYKFFGTKADQMRAIARAVPISFGRAFAGVMRETWGRGEAT